MKKKFFVLIQLFLCLLMAAQSDFAFGSQPPEDLPPAKFTIPAPDSPQAQKYLGLKSLEPFSVSNVEGKIVIIEFFSALCPQCHANAPIVNKIFKQVQEDSGLAGVKVIGIGIGSEKPQIEAYKKNFKVPFPVFLDENFAISAAMDGVEVPTTMIVAAKSGKVLASHKGVIRDLDGFLKELKELNKKQ